MNTLLRLLPIGTLVFAVALVAHGVWRWDDARDRFNAAAAQLVNVHRDSNTIESLRQQEERISFRARPEDDLIALVQAALRHAGLPSDRLADVRNEADVALPGVSDGPNYRRQSIAFTLRGMSPGDLGAFLNGWRAEQSVWLVSRLTLTAPRGRDVRNEAAGRFDVALVVSSLYLGDV